MFEDMTLLGKLIADPRHLYTSNPSLLVHIVKPYLKYYQNAFAILLMQYSSIETKTYYTYKTYYMPKFFENFSKKSSNFFRFFEKF